MTIALVAMLGSIALFLFLIFSNKSLNSVFLISLSIAVSFYLIGNYIEVANASIEAAKAGLMVRFLAIPYIPTLWFFAVREFCGKNFKSPLTKFAFLLVPTMLAFLCFTWEQNGILISGVHYLNGNNNGNLIIEYTQFVIFKNIYQVCMHLLGILTIVQCYKNGTKRFRKQAMLFMVSILIPVFNTATYIIKVGEYNIDITPYGMFLSTLLFTASLYLFGVINLADTVRENAMDHLFEGVLLFDKDGAFMDANLSARKIFPQLKEIALGTIADEMSYLPFGCDALNSKGAKGSPGEFSKEYDGVINTFSLSISKVLKKEKIIGHAVIINNISPMKKLVLRLEEKSVTDALTSIYNRGYLFEAGETVMQNAINANEVFSVIMLDIDYFKSVNDNYGHPFGDYVLKVLAQLCLGSFRKSDIVSRYGGEEFCILLPSTTRLVALSKAEALRQKISQFKFERDNIKLNVTVSLGVAEYLREHKNFDEVLKIADENLYISKESGRNRVT